MSEQPAQTTAILQVEIDDTQFQAFQAKFADFQANAAKGPEAWKATDEQIAIIKKRFDEIRTSALEQNAAAANTAENAKQSNEHTRNYVASLTTLVISSKGFGGNILSATKNLATWTRHAATLSVLFEVGGSYGIGALAAAGGSRRYQASGLGISTGEFSSFGVNFGQLGNIDSLLGGFNAASTDIRRQQPLQSLGIDSRGKNGAQLFAEALPRIKDLVDRTNPRTFQASLRPYNLDQLGFSPQMLTLLSRMPREDVMRMLRDYNTNKNSLSVPDDIGRKWQELSNQLSRAEVQIQTGLAGSLVNITPGLTKLSGSFVHLLDAMLGTPEIKKGLDRVGEGITWFAKQVGSPYAVQQVEDFITSFSATGRDIDTISQWFASNPWILNIFSPESRAKVQREGGAADERAAIHATGMDKRDLRVDRALAGRPAPTTAEQEHFNKTGVDPAGKGTRAHFGRHGPLRGAKGLTGAIAGDLSSKATYPRQDEHIDPQAFIVHHTGGRGSPEGVVQTLNARGLGVQYVMDRDGSVYRTLPDGARGAHILPGDVKDLHLSNSNTIGMEVIANDDSDVTPAETKAGVEFYKRLQQRYPGIQVYGHGYVNPGHKQATEGQTIVNAIHAAERLPDDPKRDAKQAIQESARTVPLAQRSFMGAYAGKDTVRGGKHKPEQTVTVHDETGGSARVTVAH